MHPTLDLSFESQYWSLGKMNLVGIDEVGRGSLSGPVVIAGVKIALNHRIIPGIDDSKQILPNKREKLFHQILTSIEEYSIVSISPDIIDQINILEATLLGMKQVINSFDQIDQVLIDGNRSPKNIELPIRTIIKGDQQVYSIACASILAKVYRDRLMHELHSDYPQYDWLHNVGYGTPRHLLALKQFGSTPLHRQTFLKKFHDK